MNTPFPLCVAKTASGAEHLNAGCTMNANADSSTHGKRIMISARSGKERKNELSEIRAERLTDSDKMAVYYNGKLTTTCDFWEIGDVMERLAQADREKERANENKA